MVGDGPSFLNTEAAFNAFFYKATVENGRRPTHMLWRIVRADRCGWLDLLTIAPDALTVHLKGTELAGAQVELATPENRQIRPVGTARRLRFRLPRGLTPATIVMLRSDDDWLDFRYFPAPGPGGDTDSSVIWDLPGADASVLIVGGESQYVEFKEQLPVSEHRRKMLKTVAAFASGEGGTVLIGVTDDSQIAGVDATKLDELMLALHNMIRSNIDPDPEATVRPVSVDAKRCCWSRFPAAPAGMHTTGRSPSSICAGAPIPFRRGCRRSPTGSSSNRPCRGNSGPGEVVTRCQMVPPAGIPAPDPCRRCQAGSGTTGRLARPPRAAWSL
ncbi:ATP-binding protein [Micromonospora sp. NPDC127501]|uniref:AlbA family DNA-binding domain-containing protein n=1 Tax=Micromonospora sp. NPDC127501 TaxID=3154872 RepID=UPI003332041C